MLIVAYAVRTMKYRSDEMVNAEFPHQHLRERTVFIGGGGSFFAEVNFHYFKRSAPLVTGFKRKSQYSCCASELAAVA